MALFVALSGVAYAAKTLGKNQVKAKNIAKEAVTNPKIKIQAVTSGKIKDGGVNATDIAPGAVINSKIANGSVTGAKIGNKAVTTNALANEAVTTAKLDSEAVTGGKLATSLYYQLVKNVTYVSAASGENSEATKSATATCPAGKEAIGGGVRLSGELLNVAVTGSSPFSSGASRTGWSGFAHESGGGVFNDWSLEAFAVCAEL